MDKEKQANKTAETITEDRHVEQHFDQLKELKKVMEEKQLTTENAQLNRKLEEQEDYHEKGCNLVVLSPSTVILLGCLGVGGLWKLMAELERIRMAQLQDKERKKIMRDSISHYKLNQ